MQPALSNIGTVFIAGVSTVDCAVFDPANGIVGHSWQVDVQLTGTLDDQGFVYDFSALKQLVRQVLKESIDHALLIPIGSKAVHFSEVAGAEHWQLHAHSRISEADSVWSYACPKGAVYPIRAVNLRANIIEQELKRLLHHRMPASVQDFEIKLIPETAEPTAAFFRYTHGLTKHKGLCQRLFHGHRSKIEVIVGEERRPDIEHHITRQLFGSEVHICSPDQIVEGSLEFGMRGSANQMIKVAYEAAMGKFEAVIPGDKVFLVQGETSIECIARNLAQYVKNREKTRQPIQVRVFEGIQKGAIAQI